MEISDVKILNAPIRKTSKDNDNAIHEKFTNYGRNAKEWTRKCAALLPEIQRREIWRKKRFESIYEYAAKLAGMSRSCVDTSLWVMKKIEDKPALKKIALEKGINSVRPVANLATVEDERFWAEKAKSMSQNTLRTFVKEIRKTTNVATGKDFCVNAKTEPEKTRVELILTSCIARRFEQLRKREDFEELLERFLDSVERRDLRGKPNTIENAKRHIPVNIKRYVSKKTGGKCAYPGCEKHGNIFHHTKRFAIEKSHDPDAIFLLCDGHEQLAHFGLIENEEMPPENWRVLKGRSFTADNLAKVYVDEYVNLYR